MKSFSLTGWVTGGLLMCMTTGNALHAQSCDNFFPFSEGLVLKYANYDKKDKPTGGYEMSLTDKKNTPDGIEADFTTTLFDEKGETIYDGALEAECRNGTLVFDAGQMLDPVTMSAYGSMEVEVSGDDVQIPMDAAAGTSLGDAGVRAEIRSGGMKIMTISVEVTDRMIEAHEKITTPAGTFPCVKYTFHSLTKAGFVKVEASGADWYNRDYGTIRSESYDKNGNLSAYSVLESISE